MEEKEKARRLGCELTSEPRTYSYKGFVWHKNLEDMEDILTIIQEVKPDYIIECGTGYERGRNYGGSALQMADYLQKLTGGTVITIDTLEGEPLIHPNIISITGSSISDEVVNKVKSIVRGKILLDLDSAHYASHVAKELQIYSSIIPIGSYIIIEDTCLDAPKCLGGERDGGTDGPWNGVQRFLSEHPEWETDHSKERAGHSSPGGYLKRIEMEKRI